MYNTSPQLSKLLNECGIEETLKTIDINEIDDHIIKIILTTIEHSIERLREELN